MEFKYLIKKGERSKAPNIMAENNMFFNLIGQRDFMEKVVCMQDEKEVISAFEEEGVTPTKEEIEALKMILSLTCKELKKRSPKELEEMKNECNTLTNDQLLAVSGGVKGRKKPSSAFATFLNSVKAGANAVYTGALNVGSGIKNAVTTISTAEGVVNAASDFAKAWNEPTRNQQAIEMAKIKMAATESNNRASVQKFAIGAAAALLLTSAINKKELRNWWNNIFEDDD